MRFQKARQSSWTVLLAVAACTAADSSETTSSAATDGAGDAGPTLPVRAGIDVLLDDSLHLVRERRVGLITNQTGVSRTSPSPDRADRGRERAVTSTIDRLYDHPDVELVALYSPEHGIRGDVEAGVGVSGEVDGRTGLTVHSLYGETRRPTPAMLDGIDVLVFDIQDVGARYYTYVSTMALAMDAAGAAGLDFVVLDRPNPVGGRAVQGNVLDADFATFVGMYPVPMRHGMTPAELAKLYVGAFGVEVELHTVPASGWRRSMYFGETGLPWVAPSPNMPDPTSALHYTGTCLFEGTNLSVGRGTERPFQWVGAPWLDGPELARRMARHGLPGVDIEPVTFTPSSPGDGKFGGETVQGVRLVATDRDTYDPTKTAVALLLETRRMSGDRWEWRTAHFDRLAGTDRLRILVEEEASLDEIVGPWAAQRADFERLRTPFLIY